MRFLLGGSLRCDLQVLIDSRALIQANSGGGKSHTLRRLLEQTHGHVQQLVIDPEGEFASLRERYDYGHPQSKGFVNALGRLQTLGFVRSRDGQVIALPMLFLEGAGRG